MGRSLAELHLATKNERYGFSRDNYLSITLQKNSWHNSWLDLWPEQRLSWQLELYAAKTSHNDPLLNAGELLINKLFELLGDINERAVLLHLDLCSGNAAANEKGKP